MEKDGEQHVDESLPPVGILSITFEKGINLKQANIFGSDPYVLMKPTLFGEENRTTTKYNTLNPEWNETFDFMIYDKDSQQINLTVFDYDMTTMEKMLGKAVIDISRLPFNKQIQRHIRLTDTDRGELVVSLLYIPIITHSEQVKKQAAEEELKDILFDVSKTELSNELIISHETLQQEDDLRDFEDKGSFSDVSNNTHYTTVIGANGKPALQRMNTMQQFAKGQITEAVGVLTVSQIRVSGLKVSTFTAFRPFVSCSVGSKVRNTKYQKGIANPVFNESFSFIIKDTQMDRLAIKVFDKSKWTAHKLLASLDLSLMDVVNSNGGTLEQKYMLESEHQECYISLKLTWLASAHH